MNTATEQHTRPTSDIHNAESAVTNTMPENKKAQYNSKLRKMQW